MEHHTLSPLVVVKRIEEVIEEGEQENSVRTGEGFDGLKTSISCWFEGVPVFALLFRHEGRRVVEQIFEGVDEGMEGFQRGFQRWNTWHKAAKK